MQRWGGLWRGRVMWKECSWLFFHFTCLGKEVNLRIKYFWSEDIFESLSQWSLARCQNYIDEICMSFSCSVVIELLSPLKLSNFHSEVFIRLVWWIIYLCSKHTGTGSTVPCINSLLQRGWNFATSLLNCVIFSLTVAVARQQGTSWVHV